MNIIEIPYYHPKGTKNYDYRYDRVIILENKKYVYGSKAIFINSVNAEAIIASASLHSINTVIEKDGISVLESIFVYKVGNVGESREIDRIHSLELIMKSVVEIRESILREQEDGW